MVLANRRAGMFSRGDITQLGLAYLQECLTVARAAGAVLDDSVPQEIIDGFHRAPPDLSTSISPIAGQPPAGVGYPQWCGTALWASACYCYAD